MGEQTASFRIGGMDCAEEVAILRREIGPLVGGEDNLSFDILNGRMTVRATEQASLQPDLIIAAVRRAGMTATPADDRREVAQAGPDRLRRRLLTLTIVSGAATLAGFVTHALLAGGVSAALGGSELEGVRVVPLGAKLLYGIALVAGTWTFLPKAWIALRRFRPDMNLLMIVAVCGAVYLGDWLEASMVAFLFTLSLALESWSIGRARRAVAALLNLTPPTVRVVSPGGGEQTVPAADVSPATRFVVRPGERIPLDGRVVSGDSEVNQAPLTGESVPVPKTTGDTVYAGTVNGDATLEVESTKPADQTAVANVIRLIGEAQSQRAPSEQWVDSFARYYTPVVMCLAPAVFLLGGLATGEFTVWLYRGLVLLVIACPCALVISTPVSIVAALAGATKQGVLIKGGTYVEAPARLRAIALDKTGTITRGKPAVVKVVPLEEHSESELLERAAALEAHSTHPLAVAILEHARARGIALRPVDDFRVIAGKGAVGRFDGRPFWIGSHRYLEELKQETPEVHDQISELADAGHSVVVIGNDRHVCGFIVLADEVRPAAIETIRKLREAGIERIVMLSGDNRPTAESIGKQVGVDEVRAELLPEDKVRAVEELTNQYHYLAMVGDGINDAPALARATVGIAMGGVGSDAAIETADIALMGDDISRLPWLIGHSRRTLAIIRQNIGFSLGLKGVFLVLTLFGHASLWAAIAADTGASLLVIFNGLRLLQSDDSTVTPRI
jgi:Cd2+/Zn2+-exporting ATPase